MNYFLCWVIGILAGLEALCVGIVKTGHFN